MQDCIALVEPAWLRVDQILYRPAGQGSYAVVNLLGADPHDRGWIVRIDQSPVVTYLDRGLYWSDCKPDGVFNRNRRPHLHRRRACRKALFLRIDQINAEGEHFDIDPTPVVSRELVAVSVRLARKCDPGFETKTCRVGHPKAKLAGVHLCQQRQSGPQQKHRNALEPKRGYSLIQVGLHGRVSEIRLGRENDVRIIISLGCISLWANRAASDELLLKNCKFFVALQFTNEVLTSVTFDILTAGIDGRGLVEPSIKLTHTTIAEVEQSLCKRPRRSAACRLARPFNPST